MEWPARSSSMFGRLGAPVIFLWEQTRVYLLGAMPDNPGRGRHGTRVSSQSGTWEAVERAEEGEGWPVLAKLVSGLVSGNISSCSCFYDVLNRKKKWFPQIRKPHEAWSGCVSCCWRCCCGDLKMLYRGESEVIKKPCSQIKALLATKELKTNEKRNNVRGSSFAVCSGL